MLTRFGHLGLATGLVTALVLGATPQAARAADPPVQADEIATGLSIPWDVAFAPDGTMMVTERIGRVRVFSSGSVGAALVRTVTIPSVSQVGESGLAGNGYVYVCANPLI